MEIYVRPLDGKKVRRPDNMRHLKPEGEKVRKETYWVRRVKDGDVEVFEPSEKKTMDVKPKELKKDVPKKSLKKKQETKVEKKDSTITEGE